MEQCLTILKENDFQMRILYLTNHESNVRKEGKRNNFQACKALRIFYLQCCLSQKVTIRWCHLNKGRFRIQEIEILHKKRWRTFPKQLLCSRTMRQSWRTVSKVKSEIQSDEFYIVMTFTVLSENSEVTTQKKKKKDITNSRKHIKCFIGNKTNHWT